MKIKGKLRYMLLTITMVVTAFGVTKGSAVKAAGEVAAVVAADGTETPYPTFEEAVSHAGNHETVKLLDNYADNAATIDVGYKYLMIDLNGKTLTLNSVSTGYGLTIKNGGMTAYISNASSSGNYGALIVDGAVLTLPSGLQWLSDDGMELKNGSYVDLKSGSFNLTTLTMTNDCVFSVNCQNGIFNYGRPGNGFDAVKDYIPEGYSIGTFQRYSDTIQTILDENGGNATNYVLRYRGLSDSLTSITLNPTEYVYDGTAKKPAVTVIYDGKVLTEGISYTLTYADNTNVGTATVTIDGKNSLHGQIVKDFVINKANQAAPTGLTPTAESVDGKNDGQIANLTTAMEYSVDQSVWTACTDTKMINLPDGDYYVRFKETANYYASPSTKVTVAKGTIPAQQDTTESTTTQTATTQQTKVDTPKDTTTQEPTGVTDKTVSTGDAYPLAIMLTLMIGTGVWIVGMIRRRKNHDCP